MVNTAHHPDAGLPDALAKHARVATDGELVVEASAGLLVGITLTIWRPMLWLPLACASLCVGAFGAWGIADRELRERTARSASPVLQLLRATRAVVATIGALSAIVLLFAIVSAVLGTWIS